MNTTYIIHATYETKGLNMFRTDTGLFEAIGEESSSSGCGFGFRDHDFSKSTKKEADDLAEKIGNFFLAKNIEYTIDVEKV